MYIIEMHEKHHAHARIVMEKGDYNAPKLEIRQVIINHAGDLKSYYCQWCASVRKEKHAT